MKILTNREFQPHSGVTRTCLLVLGMHRSGTSAITRVLALLGADLPANLMKPASNNAAGFWESQSLMRLNETILAECGSSWDDWRALPWGRARELEAEWKDELARLLLEEFRQAPLFVLKDPRICRFAPFYLDTLTELGVAPRVVIPLRNPLAAAASLRERDGMTPGFAYLLWLRHVLEAEAHTRLFPRVFVSYEALLDDWRATARHLESRLAIPFPRSRADADADIDVFVRRDLAHHAPSARDLDASDAAGWVKEAYHAAQALERDPADLSARFTLDTIRAEFDRSSAVCGDAALTELTTREARLAGHARRSLETAAHECAAHIEKTREKEVEVAARKAEIIALTSAFSAQARAEKRLARRVNAANTALGHLRGAVRAQKAQLLELDEAARGSAGEIAELRNHLEQKAEEALAGKAALAEAETQRDTLKRASEGHARELANESEARAVATRETAELKNALVLSGRKAEALLSDLGQVEKERDKLKKAALARDHEIKSLGAAVAQGDREFIALRAREEAFLRSRSWRMTAPLRAAATPLARLARKLRSTAARTVKGRAAASSDSLKAVRDSGLFDEAWYLERYPDVRLAGLDPLDHFLTHGGKERRDPGPAFSTEAYFATNPDVKASRVNPLLHYVLFGEKEGRRRGFVGRRPDKSEFPDTFALKSFVPAARIALVIHVYYPEMWPELRNAARNIPAPVDIFVTLIKASSESLIQTVRHDFPNAHVFVLPNHGRDVYPFLFLVNTGVLCKYDLVCKIHSKKSPHREDGKDWRKSLLKSLLGSAQRVRRIMTAFARDPDLGIVAADENVFSSEYWGSNEETVQGLGARLYIAFKTNDVKFAAGSMFWVHPLVLRQLMLLGLTDEDFEAEGHQLDGTMAHAMERFTGILAQSMRMQVLAVQDAIGAPKSTLDATAADRVKLVAFYLPQFHPIAENDAWWGKGFTEWTNVVSAAPLFSGHRQPRLPGELGYYDLRLPEVREAQVRLARAHGIGAFCYHYYWFDGRRLLERPLDEMVRSGQPDFPFCLCWANENWTRGWDGLHRDVLVSQSYTPERLSQFAVELIPYFKDPRYLRHHGHPVLLIYRLTDIPNFRLVIREWRRLWQEKGAGAVHLCAVQFHLNELPRRPQDAGLDAYVEFPPHGARVRRLEKEVSHLASDFDGLIYSYADVVEGSLAAHADSDTSSLHRGVMLGWDNTARRGKKAHICHGATPGNFRAWVRGVIEQETAKRPRDEHLVFINAWNEWAEGTCLEPDTISGRGYLEAVRSAKYGVHHGAWTEAPPRSIEAEPCR